MKLDSNKEEEQEEEARIDTAREMATTDKQEEAKHNKTRGYLIALIQETRRLRAFGSPADRADCDEILEINGRPIGGPKRSPEDAKQRRADEEEDPQEEEEEHERIVRHIQECIRLKNISLRVRRPIAHLMDEIERDSALLDVFVIGTDAQQQLSRFFKLTNILNGQQDLVKLSSRMEMLQFSGGGGGGCIDGDGPIQQSIEEPIIKTSSEETQDDEQKKANKDSWKVHSDEDKENNNINGDGNHHDEKSKLNANFEQRLRQSKLNRDEQIGANDDDHDDDHDDDGDRSSTKLSPICLRLRQRLREFGRVSDEAKLESLLEIYERISRIQAKSFQVPELTSSSGRPLHVLDTLHWLIQLLNEQLTGEGATTGDDVRSELLSILCRQELHSVCGAFDCVKSKLIKRVAHDTNDVNMSSSLGAQTTATTPSLNGTAFERLVCIQKNCSQALGATIKNDASRRVLIGRIIRGGVAHRSGLLNEGDELLEVNGVRLAGMDINQVIELLNQMDDALVFRIRSGHLKRVAHSDTELATVAESVFVRTLFEFDADKQAGHFLVPCRELALSFGPNEILQVIDQTDRNWWQARRVEPEEEEGDNQQREQHIHLPGLIPSIEYLKQHRRQQQQQRIEDILPPASGNFQIHSSETNAHSKNDRDNNNRRDNLVFKLLFNCPHGSSPKRRKQSEQTEHQHQQESPQWPVAECQFYEQVVGVSSLKLKLRPIFLFGPKLIGQNELLAKLLQLNGGGQFSSAISHTTRPRKSHELDGVDFHFVSRREFEAKIHEDEFIEFGSYQNHLYGTSIESIRQVTSSQKICVQLVNLASISSLRNGRAGRELKPIFVFVRPDLGQPDRLRQLVVRSAQQQQQLSRGRRARSRNRPTDVEERILGISAEVRQVEANHLASFDLTLTMADPSQGLDSLLKQLAEFQAARTQWIPAAWQLD